jgi:hypothetical protein
MTLDIQAAQVKEIAGIMRDYRDGAKSLVKFMLKCSLRRNKAPIAGAIVMKPTMKDERFQIGDPAYKGKYASDRDAFFAAFDQFASLDQFLAWNGRLSANRNTPPVQFFSEGFSLPTMQIELAYRLRGQPDEKTLSIMLAGFDDNEGASAFAQRQAHLIKDR